MVVEKVECFHYISVLHVFHFYFMYILYFFHIFSPGSFFMMSKQIMLYMMYNFVTMSSWDLLISINVE